MKVLGLDVGSRTIGIAVTDELGLTAQGLRTLRRSSLASDVTALRELVKERNIERVVVGLPVQMNGQEGAAAESARQFGRVLEERLKLPIEFWDERLTTAEAERLLLQADLSRQKRKQAIDRLAAVIILQSWLDARSAGNPHREPSP